MDKYDYDIIDGRKVSPLVIQEDYILNGIHRGSIYIESGNFKLNGINQGPLIIGSNTNVEIYGSQQGSVLIKRGSNVSVYGSIEGSVEIEEDGVVIVESRGKIAGSLDNNGMMVLRGVFGGPKVGVGKIEVEGKGRIIHPKLVDGTYYYNF